MTIDVVEHMGRETRALPGRGDGPTRAAEHGNEDVVGTQLDPALGKLVRIHGRSLLPVVVQTRSLVQGWLFYELFPAQHTQARRQRRRGRSGQNRHVCPRQWCGWWMRAPLDLETLSRLLSQEGLVGPLFFLPNADAVDTHGGGALLSPFRFTERECGVSLARVVAAQNASVTVGRDGGEIWQEAPAKKVHGEFCLAAGLGRAIGECFDDGGDEGGSDHSARQVVMVVELRFEKCLSAWIEASRGLMVRGEALRASQAGAVPC